MTPEQEALIRKAHDSLKGARALYDIALYGFAVSRAYYTMFYIASAFLHGKGLSFSKHSGVISAFGQEFVKSRQLPEKYHRYLLDGQDIRQIGDYETSKTVGKTEAEDQISRAEEFIQLSEQHIGKLPPAK